MKNSNINVQKSKQILLNTQIIADELASESWISTQKLSNGTPNLKHFEIYKEGSVPNENILYYITKQNAKGFPVDSYSYVSCFNIDGKAPHICAIQADEILVIDKMIQIFQKYRDFEIEFNNILINGQSLDDLCKAGSRFLNNPLYVHDRNFTILSISERIPGMLEFEKSEATGGLQIPLWLIDQFKFDPDYRKTLEQNHSAIWGTDQYPHNIRSLYVNIREGDFYYGRVLINEITSKIKLGQFRLLETFGEYVKEIILRDQIEHPELYTRYEDLFRRLACGDTNVDTKALSTFFKIRNWNADDEYLCLIFQTQDESLSIRSESAIRAILMEEFHEAFDFFNDQKLCLILNMTKMKSKITNVRNTLPTLVRDSYMYCGISNRISGYKNLTIGFKEAEIALKYVREDSSVWIRVFVDVALDYALDNINSAITTQHLIAP